MRITNKIIQNNSVANINTNKTLQDKLNNQMATEKKISRPSEDPVVAIRALRLRTNVSQTTQYYAKNVPDAESWISLTESALSTVTDVITDMIEKCTSGASEKLTTTEGKTILDALKSLSDEIYSTGNADYAGRNLFTGYRTESSLSFDSTQSNKKYTITEQVNSDVIDSIKYINSDYLNGLNEANFNTAENEAIKEQDVEEASIHRIRLSYDNIDATTLKVEIYNKSKAGSDKVSEMYDDSAIITPTCVSKDANPNPYELIKGANTSDPAVSKMIFIPETGELLMTDDIYLQLKGLSDDVTTPDVDESQIRITYEKSTWDKGDLKPEHYFYCVESTVDKGDITYNPTYIEGKADKQAIEYDVGVGQTIRVNTTADEVFTHDIGRDVEDLVSVLDEVVKMEETISNLESIRDNLDPEDPDIESKRATLEKQLDAANKAFTLLNEKRQNMFESAITKMQNYLNQTNKATTACGTRGQKLELIKNRLMNQKTNFETLESENENVDITDVAIQLSSAKLTYNAALMSVGKILETSLMNYI